MPASIHIRGVREAHKWHGDPERRKIYNKERLLITFLPDGMPESMAEQCLDMAMNRMLMAIAKVDETMATTKEARSPIQEPCLSALNEDDINHLDDPATITRQFRHYLSGSRPDDIAALLDDVSDLSWDDLLKVLDCWKGLPDDDVVMLMYWTLWHSGPALAWRRTDK